jgi:hypothetical protein
MKKKAGQIILEHDALRNTLDDDITEYRRAMEPDIINSILETAEKSKNQYPYINKDFYIVLLQTVDRVLKQPRNIVLARQSCPTPVFKQSVWKYRSFSDSLEFLWSIPDSLLYYHIINNAAQYLADEECRDLAKFTLLMESGELLTWVKKENGEKDDAVILNKEGICLN